MAQRKKSVNDIWAQADRIVDNPRFRGNEERIANIANRYEENITNSDFSDKVYDAIKKIDVRTKAGNKAINDIYNLQFSTARYRDGGNTDADKDTEEKAMAIANKYLKTHLSRDEKIKRQAQRLSAKANISG